MTTLSVHPIEYLKDHADYAHIMKKMLQFLMVVGITLGVVGAFYNTLGYNAATERDVLTQTYMNAFPAAMPDVMIAPAGPFAPITF